jgi:hypothetical protein
VLALNRSGSDFIMSRGYERRDEDLLLMSPDPLLDDIVLRLN